jgi:lysophospholipase L1-like esterase
VAAALAGALLASAAPAPAQPLVEGPSALSGAAALGPFFAALDRLKAGARQAPVQILQIGDSHSAADHISSGVRARLQARFGEGGRGVLPPGVPFKAYSPRQIDVTQSAGWTLEPSFPLGSGSGPFGLSGWRLTSTRPGAALTLSADPEALFDRAVLCAMAGPGSGALTVSAGDARTEVSFGAPTRGPVCRAVPFGGLERKLELSAQGGPVTLLSFGAWRASGGISLSNLGVIGAQLYDFAARDDRILTAELQAYAPDLIVLAFGTNEGFRRELDPAAYEQLVREQIRRLKRLAPGAAILLLGPPDANAVRPDIPEDGVHDLNFACAPLTPAEIADYPRLVAERSLALARWYAPPALAQVREAQRRAAAAEGAAFWDWRARMGGDCSAHRLSRPGVGLVRGDHVHFTSDGGDLIAAMLSRDLMAAYDARGMP